MKKFFSLVLALVMALSLTTVAWGADMTEADLQSLLTAGGNVTLTSDVTVTTGLSVPTGKTVTLDLNGKTITGAIAKDAGVILTNNGTLKVVGGTMENTATNGAAVIDNAGTLTLDDVTINGAPIGDTGYPAYAVYSSGPLTIEDGTTITSDRGALNVGADTVINGGSFITTEKASSRVLTLHTVYAYGGTLTINGGSFENKYTGVSGASVICPAGSTIEINGGTFRDAVDDTSDFNNTANIQNYMGYGKPIIVRGGSFDDNTVTKNVAADYAATESNGVWTVAEKPYAAKIGNTKYETLQAAVDNAENGDVITLGSDLTEKVTVTQKPDVKFTIDGANKTFTGTITVDGKSSRYETAGVTIQNVNFVADNLLKDACIGLGVSGNNNTRYTNNVTVKDCIFTGTGNTAVAVKSYTGGDWNLTIEGCTVNSGMHSMLQAANVEKGLKIADCKVYSESGINLNNTLALEMSGCTFDVQGYAVRVGVDGTVNTTEKTFNITDSTLKSACADGDAVIIFRDSSEKATMTITDTTLTGTTTFAGNTDVTDIFVDGDLVGAVAEVVGGNQYKTLTEAVAAAPAGGTVKLLADCGESVTVAKNLTFDFNGYNFTGFITPASGYTYMDGVVKKAVSSGTTSTGSVTSGTVTPVKAKLYRLAAAGGSMTELNIKVEKIEKTTVTGKLVNDVPAYVPNIYKINDTTYYVEVAKADATFALKNNGAYVYLAPATGCTDANAVITKFATAVVLDQYVAAAEDVECGDAIKGTKGAAIYMSGNDAYYADGSDWAYFKGEFVKYNAKAKVDFQPHKWDAKSIIVKSTDVKGTKVPVSIECEKCEKTFSIVPSAKFDNTWVKGVNYTTDNAVDKYNTAAVKYYIVLENAAYTGTYVPSVPSTDKVQSADTFDAGIAMYVGMSVMAATGSVVVLKKRED